MINDSSTFGIPHERLAQLWDLHSDREGGDQEYDRDLPKLELLNDMLARKLPPDRVVAQALPGALTQIGKDVRPFTGDSLGHLLLDPETDPSIIKQIKAYYKGLSKHTQSENERDVIAVLYHAAIASAWVYHQERITSFSNRHLQKAFLKYSAYTWLNEGVKSLFHQASMRC